MRRDRQPEKPTTENTEIYVETLVGENHAKRRKFTMSKDKYNKEDGGRRPLHHREIIEIYIHIYKKAYYKESKHIKKTLKRLIES